MRCDDWQPGDWRHPFGIRFRVSLDQSADSTVNSALWRGLAHRGYLSDFLYSSSSLPMGCVIRAAQAHVLRLVDRPINFGDMVWLNWKLDFGLVPTH